MPKLYLIHPAVGCARMGNSEDGVQIASEVPYGPSIGSLLDLPGISGRPDLMPLLHRDSFRGLDNKIRRQGVRFRIFEYDFKPDFFGDLSDQERKAAGLFLNNNGNTLNSHQEITTATHDIEWTVELANKKVIDWTFTGTPDAKGHIKESDIRFTYNDNVAKKTVSLADIAREGTPVRELMESGRLKLGDMVVEPTGQMILIGSTGDTIAPHITGPLASPRLANLINRNWQDGAADGPVTAKIRPKGSNEWIDIGDQGNDHWNGNAWAIVGPPRFGGDVNPIVSLYDVALSLATNGTRRPGTNGYFTIYSRDIYPILRGLAMVTQVYVSAHNTDPSNPAKYIDRNYHGPTRRFIDPVMAAFDPAHGGPLVSIKEEYFRALLPPDDIARISDPYPPYTYSTDATSPNSLGITHPPLSEFISGLKTMPRLFQLSLTHLQYQHMAAWRTDTHFWKRDPFVNDLPSPPAPPLPSRYIPFNIDLAHMRAISGGSFIPGIEVGRNVWNRNLWSIVPFDIDAQLVRLNDKSLNPGDLTKTLGNPWQYDYKDCDDDWWPATRPISLQVDAPTLPGVPAPPAQHYRWHREVPVWSVPNGDDPLLHIWKELGYIRKLDGSWQVKEEERIELTPDDNKPYPAP